MGNEDTRVEIVRAIGEKKKKKTLVRHSLSLVFRRPCKIERLAKKAGSFALLSFYPLLKHIRPRAITRSL